MTGASSGIGAALARHYAERGATLGLAARRAAQLQTLADSLPTRVCIYALDVADSAALAAAAQDFIVRHGVPDIVIANAGISAGTRSELAADIAVLSRIMQINMLGLAATLQPFVAPMRERGSGVLAGIASIAGFRGLAGAGAYCASKSAAITWLESLRLELHGSGVDVVTICPGFVATPLTAVNRNPMPFLLEAPDAARRIARAIAAKKRLAIIPWQMRLVFFFLRRMPNWLYDRLFARAPRKPRDLPA
ncbi:MAG: short-chain dehydrogenase [Betaproteobacteria bacterium RIFCSPLOWO2_12_FULL_64_23]|nr:MAG: short-chain dehydrogenase [Betaproteobacteria bacterium RIFCSPLOWO2_12_FULL_64_23]